MPIFNAIPYTLPPLRKGRGFTQAELADRIGASKRNLEYWEKGSRQPNAEQVAELAKVLDCTTDDLLIIK